MLASEGWNTTQIGIPVDASAVLARKRGEGVLLIFAVAVPATQESTENVQ